MPSKTEKRREVLINIAYWAVILLLLYFVCRYVIGWLMPLLIGVVIARLLNPLIKFISRKTRIPRKLVAFTMVILSIATVGILLWVLGTQVFLVVREQVTKLPGYYSESLLPSLLRLESYLAENMKELFPGWDIASGSSNIVAGLTDAVSSLPSAFGRVFNWTIQAPGVVLRVMFTLLFTVFGSVYYEEAAAFVMRQFSLERQVFLRDTFSSLKRSLVSYYGAYLKIMLVAFAELTVGLSIVRGTFSILPALGIAVVDFFPVLGCGTVMVPWALIHLLTGNYYLAAGILVVYAVVLVVRQFIEPKIVGDQLGLNPLLTLTAIYLGYLSMGILGMILLPIVVTIIADLQREGKIKLFN